MEAKHLRIQLDLEFVLKGLKPACLISKYGDSEYFRKLKHYLKQEGLFLSTKRKFKANTRQTRSGQEPPHTRQIFVTRSHRDHLRMKASAHKVPISTLGHMLGYPAPYTRRIMTVSEGGCSGWIL